MFHVLYLILAGITYSNFNFFFRLIQFSVFQFFFLLIFCRRKVLVTHENSNIDITGEILQCLGPGAWLNDEVVL